MRGLRGGFAALLILACAGNVSAKTVQVTASGFSFSPSAVTINTGDSIQWVLGGGSHTTTSGTGSSDPQVGVLWDAPLNSLHTSFTRRFTSVGTFPYFCRPHEFFGMKGTITVTMVTGIFDDNGDGALLPSSLLNQNVPNPFNAGTVISFSLRSDRPVSLVVYDILGRRVRALLSGVQRAGASETSWDGRDDQGRAVATGVYFYRLVVDGEAPLTRKMVLLR